MSCWRKCCRNELQARIMNHASRVRIAHGSFFYNWTTVSDISAREITFVRTKHLFLRLSTRRFLQEKIKMKKFWSGLVLAGLYAVAINLRADDADKTPPSYDMKAQSLLDLERVRKKFVHLANAVTANKLTWRPTPDSRSFAEVFLHVAGERYGILGMMGATAPADFNGKTFEKSTTDRDKIVAEL